VHARIARVLFGTGEPRAGGGAISQGQFFDQGFLNHRVRVEGGLLAEESGALLKDFFKARRG
jgi:tRNA(adenine34) deaminase